MDISFKICKHKYFEFEAHKWSIKDCRNFFEISLKWTTKIDHAGLEFIFEIYGFEIRVTVYDNRHWNYSCDRWFD